MIETPEQFAYEAYAALSTPILHELQERERDVLAYLSQFPPVSATVER